jgi:hypothetical protein
MGYDIYIGNAEIQGISPAPPASLFVVRIMVGGDSAAMSFSSIADAIRDTALAQALAEPGSSCHVWAGDLLLTSRPLTSARELHELLVERSRAILGRLL